MKEPLTIAIVGGGFSGTLSAIHLLRSRSAQPINIILIDRKTPVTRPKKRYEGSTARQIYSDYIAHLYSQAVANKAAHITVERTVDEAISIITNATETRAVITLKSGRMVFADNVILATGSIGRKKTGPIVPRFPDALLADLRNRLIIKLSRDGKTIKTTGSGALIDATGKASPMMYAVGSLRRQTIWGKGALKEVYLQTEQLCGALSGYETATDIVAAPGGIFPGPLPLPTMWQSAVQPGMSTFR